MYKLLGHKDKPDLSKVKDGNRFPSTCRVGLEVELENTDRHDMKVHEGLMKWWKATNDGSLKVAGTELVLRRPLSGQELEDSLSELERYFQTEAGKRCTAGARTSIHLHLDILDMTRQEFYRLLLLYSIFETSLYKLVGPSRWDNNNCLPVAGTHPFVEAVNALKGKVRDRVREDLINYSSESGKYCGLNLSSLFASSQEVPLADRGSLEFRMHEGTCDVDKVRLWVDVVQRMKSFAMSGFDEVGLPHMVSEIGPEEFARMTFGEDLAPLFINQAGFYGDIYSGTRNAEFIQNLDNLGKMFEEYSQKAPEVRLDELVPKVTVRGAPRRNPRGDVEPRWVVEAHAADPE